MQVCYVRSVDEFCRDVEDHVLFFNVFTPGDGTFTDLGPLYEISNDTGTNGRTQHQILHMDSCHMTSALSECSQLSPFSLNFLKIDNVSRSIVVHEETTQCQETKIQKHLKKGWSGSPN